MLGHWPCSCVVCVCLFTFFHHSEFCFSGPNDTPYMASPGTFLSGMARSACRRDAYFSIFMFFLFIKSFSGLKDIPYMASPGVFSSVLARSACRHDAIFPIFIFFPFIESCLGLQKYSLYGFYRGCTRYTLYGFPGVYSILPIWLLPGVYSSG